MENLGLLNESIPKMENVAQLLSFIILFSFKNTPLLDKNSQNKHGSITLNVLNSKVETLNQTHLRIYV